MWRTTTLKTFSGSWRQHIPLILCHLIIIVEEIVIPLESIVRDPCLTWFVWGCLKSVVVKLLGPCWPENCLARLSQDCGIWRCWEGMVRNSFSQFSIKRSNLHEWTSLVAWQCDFCHSRCGQQFVHIRQRHISRHFNLKAVQNCETRGTFTLNSATGFSSPFCLCGYVWTQWIQQ